MLARVQLEREALHEHRACACFAIRRTVVVGGSGGGRGEGGGGRERRGRGGGLRRSDERGGGGGDADVDGAQCDRVLDRVVGQDGMRKVVQCREEGVEARREAGELEQVFVHVHEPAAGVGERQEQAAGGDVRWRLNVVLVCVCTW